MNVFINGVPFHTRRSVLPWLSTIVVCWCLHTHRNSKAWIGGVVDLMSNRKGRERDGEWQAAKSHKSESNPVPLQQGLRLCTWGTCSTGRATRTPSSKPKFCQRTIRCRQKKALKSKHIVRLSACDVSIAEEEDVAKMSLKQIPSTFLCLKTMILKSMELNKDTCKKRSSDPELQE